MAQGMAADLFLNASQLAISLDNIGKERFSSLLIDYHLSSMSLERLCYLEYR